MGRREEAYSRDGNHPQRVVWEGVKRAGGEVASPLCDMPTGKSDEGLSASCRVLCNYVCTYTTAYVGMEWDGVFQLMIDWKSSMTKEWKKCPKKGSLTIYLITDWKKWPQIYLIIYWKKVVSDFYIAFFPEREHQRVNSYELTLANGENGTDTRHTTYSISEY